MVFHGIGNNLCIQTAASPQNLCGEVRQLHYFTTQNVSNAELWGVLCCLTSQLIDSGNGLVLNRQLAITWTNGDHVLLLTHWSYCSLAQTINNIIFAHNTIPSPSKSPGSCLLSVTATRKKTRLCDAKFMCDDDLAKPSAKSPLDIISSYNKFAKSTSSVVSTVFVTSHYSNSGENVCLSAQECRRESMFRHITH